MNLWLQIITILLAVTLDFWWAEPRRFHPLVGFGWLTKQLEQSVYADSRLRGLLALLLLVVPLTSFTALIEIHYGGVIFDVLLLYLAIGHRSLGQHARSVLAALNANDLKTARQKVGAIVSRDTQRLDQPGIVTATIESVLENGNDALFAAIFWYVVAGAPGLVAYRLVNTLDAMWGYRNARYLQFGWAAARLDDVMSFPPSQLTALGYALVGKFLPGLRCWLVQGVHWKSCNAGSVMASGAGSLGIVLGGATSYHGVLESRAILGEGRVPDTVDIERALDLIRHTLIIALLVLLIGSGLIYSLSQQSVLLLLPDHQDRVVAFVSSRIMQ